MMAQPSPKHPPRRRHVLYTTAATLLMLLAVAGGIAWYMSTPRFSGRVRQKLVATLEQATGGRVDIGSFQWNVRHLGIEVNDLTIHGKEGPDQAPYLHIDHVRIHAKIITFFVPRIGLASLVADHPVFHLIVYPDGTTNQPRPKVQHNTRPLPQTLLDLEIDSTRIKNGIVLLNNRAVPWEMAAGPLQLAMLHIAKPTSYDATVSATNLTFKLSNAKTAHSVLAANVLLAKNAVHLTRLNLKTGSSALTASGSLTDFENPSWNASLQGGVDAGEMGAILGLDDLRHGTAQIALQAHGAAPRNFEITGTLNLRQGEWEAPWLRLRNVDVRTSLLLNPREITLPHFTTRLEDGGGIDGSLRLTHWMNLPPAPLSAQPAENKIHRELSRLLHRKRPSRAAKQSAVLTGHAQPTPITAALQAHVSDITLPLILGAVAPRRYENIGFATAATGDVKANWTGAARGLIVQGAFTLRAPRGDTRLIPVAGTTRATYLQDSRHLIIESGDFTTPGTKVQASGTLDLFPHDMASALRGKVVTTNLREFDRLITDLNLRATPSGPAPALPVHLLSNASFAGTWEGSLFHPHVVGHVDVQGFQTEVRRSASKPVHTLTWDQLHLDLDYSEPKLAIHHAVITRGSTVLHAEMELQPDRVQPRRFADATYKYDNRTQVNISLNTENASVADLQSVVGTGYPASGTIAATAQASGSVDDLHGKGHLLLTHGELYRQPISKVAATFAAAGHELQATSIQIAVAGGRAAGQLSYDYETAALHGALTGQGLSLAQIAVLKGQRFPLGGNLAFHMTAAGVGSSPGMSGALQLENLTLNGVPMGSLHAETQLQHGTVFITSQAELDHAHLHAGGQVRLGGDYLAQMQLTFTGFDVDPFLRLVASSNISAQSAIDGRVDMSGPLRKPVEIQADAHIDSFSGKVDTIPLRSEGPIHASVRNGQLQLDPVHIRGRDTDLQAAGTVDLMGDRRLRMHGSGSLNVAILSTFNNALQSTGGITFLVDARGTTRQPHLRGTAQFSHVNLHVANVTNGLTDLNGELVFDQDRLEIQKLTGSSGGGEVNIAGYIGYRGGLYLDLNATANGVRIRYPVGVSSTANAKLRLMGTTDTMLLSGNVLLTRFGLTSNADLAALASTTSGVSSPINPASPLNRVRLEVHLTSAPELGFQNSFASLAGDVDLRIRGTLENPSVLGRVDVTEGTANFAGTKYRLQQGDIVFSNPVTIEPVIDLEATARVQNYNIVIGLHGPPSNLDVSYRSEPPLTQSDVLALLALGRTNEQAAMYGEQRQAGANLMTEALLGGALNAAVSNKVEHLFGVGSVRVDPNFVGTLGESTARVTVAEQVGSNLTLTFSTNVNTTAQQLIQAQYDLTQNVSIIAVRDEASVFSLYLQIRGKRK